MAVDPRDFLLNTDYEMDKIVFFAEGEVANFSNDSPTHDLGFAPLVFGVFSYNSDFSDSRTMPYTEVTTTQSISVDVYSSDTGVTIWYQDQNNTHPKIYYRLYGFEPSNSTAKVPPTSGHAKKFVLNTDYNYCKLFKKGIINGTGSVTHNLGYIPQVLVWEQNGNIIIPIDDSAPSDPWVGYVRYVNVTPTEISAHGYSKVHYRIYYDEA